MGIRIPEGGLAGRKSFTLKSLENLIYALIWTALADVRRPISGGGYLGGVSCPGIRDCLPLDPEEFRRRPTENLDPVLVA